MPRCAAMDIGSNSIKLLVLDARSRSDYDIIHDRAVVTGLGAGLGPAGELDADAVRRSIECIASMHQAAADLGAARITVAGTSALRRAKDSAEFKAEVYRRTGLVVRVLSGEQEARFSRVIAREELGKDADQVLFFDVGGGSTELTLFDGAKVEAEASLPLGARRQSEQAGLTQPAKEQQLSALRLGIAGVLADKAPSVSADLGSGLQVAGLGGTATALAWMLAGAPAEGFSPHLAAITTGQLRDTVVKLSTMDVRQIESLPKMDSGRAKVFLAGVVVIGSILDWYGAKEFTLVDRGLRFGLILSELRTEGVEQPS